MRSDTRPANGSSADGLVRALGLPLSMGSKLAASAAPVVAIAAWLALRVLVSATAPVSPAAVHAGLWVAWLLWLDRFRPRGGRPTSVRRWFVLSAMPGAGLAFAQMIWPAVAGVTDGTSREFGASQAAGVVLVAAGAALFLCGSRTLGVTRLMFVQEFAPVAFHLESSGIYATLRHPCFAGALLMSVGAALIVGGAALVPAAINVAVLPIYVLIEDRRLVRVHGEAYATYRRRVPAVVPRVWRASAEPDTLTRPRSR